MGPAYLVEVRDLPGDLECHKIPLLNREAGPTPPRPCRFLSHGGHSCFGHTYLLILHNLLGKRVPDHPLDPEDRQDPLLGNPLKTTGIDPYLILINLCDLPFRRKPARQRPCQSHQSRLNLLIATPLDPDHLRGHRETTFHLPQLNTHDQGFFRRTERPGDQAVGFVAITKWDHCQAKGPIQSLTELLLDPFCLFTASLQRLNRERPDVKALFHLGVSLPPSYEQKEEGGEQSE